MLDLVLRDGLVAVPGGPYPLDLGIAGSRIVQAGEPGTLSPAARELRLDGRLVVPGGVDPHVHCDIPLLSPIDGSPFRGGGPDQVTRAALFGGTTTILDFVTVPPGEAIGPLVDARVAAWARSSRCDYSFHVWLHGDLRAAQLAEVPGLIERGFPSFKVFTTDGLPNRRGRKVPLGSLGELLVSTARHRGIVALHAEDDDLVMHMYERLTQAGETHFVNMPRVHSGLAEELAFRRVIRLAADIKGAAIYFMHVSSAGGVAAIAEARAGRQPVFGETLHQYALRTEDAYRLEGGQQHHTYPSLKSEADVAAIWRGLTSGVLSTFGTDEIATSRAMKLAGDRIDNVVGGHAGIEPRMALLYTEIVDRRGLGLDQFVRLTSTNASRIFGLYPAKGVIAVGSDADLVVLDTGIDRPIDASQLHETDYSPWDGWRVTAWPSTVIRGGVPVIIDGEEADLRPGRLIGRAIRPDIFEGPAV